MPENERGAGRQREWKLKKGLDAFGNMFGLNICFVIGCLPVITIGASLAATYAMAIRLQENEEETVLHGYIHEFKRSFKQATIAFLGFAVAVAVLLAEWILINTTTGAISIFYTIVFYLELLFVALIMAFLFPMIARYNTTLKQAVKNSILLSVGYFFSCVKILVAWVAPIALSIIYPIIFLHTWYLWLLIIFGAIIYGTSYTIRHVFKQNEQALHEAEENAKEEERKKLEEERQLEEGRAALEEGRMRLEAREDDVTDDDTESQEGGHGMTEAEREHESAKDPEDMSIQEEQKEEKVSQKPSQSEELAKNLQQTKNAPDQGKQQEQKMNQGTKKVTGAKKGSQGKKVQQEQKSRQEKQEGQKRSEKYQEHVRIQKKQAEKRAEKARENAEKSKQNAEKSKEITEKAKQNSEKPKVQSADKTKVQNIIQKQKSQQNVQNSGKKGPSRGR